MTIDAETAWAALLRARTIWRGGSPPAPVEIADSAGGALELSPDGTWQASGCAVQVGAAALLELYLPLLRPTLAIGQLGQSLDGRIATRTGHSHYVTGPESLVHLHRLRALVDAVVVGAGTVLADDPRLTVRHCPGANPLRVVLDPRRRLTDAHHVFTDGAAPTLVIGAVDGAAPGAARSETLPLAAGEDGFAPARILGLLAARGARRVLVEGGGVTVSRFLAAGALDVLHVAIAPMLIGSGRQGISLPPIDRLDQALRPQARRIPLGEDMLYALSFR